MHEQTLTYFFLRYVTFNRSAQMENSFRFVDQQIGLVSKRVNFSLACLKTGFDVQFSSKICVFEKKNGSGSTKLLFHFLREFQFSSKILDSLNIVVSWIALIQFTQKITCITRWVYVSHTDYLFGLLGQNIHEFTIFQSAIFDLIEILSDDRKMHFCNLRFICI